MRVTLPKEPLEMRYTTNTLGHNVVEDDEPEPVTPEQMAAIARAIRQRTGEPEPDYEAERVKELEQLRQARLTREALADLSPDELAAYQRENNPVAIIQRLAELARREVDEHWLREDQERQHQEYQEWVKTQTAGIGSNGIYKKTAELAEAGSQRAQERLAARERRMLEAETHSDDLTRILAGLDDDERKVMRRLAAEQPSEMERIQQWKGEHRNPIADVNDAKQLYRLATQKPKREEWIPPTADIENIDNPKTLFKMAARDMRKAGK
jgi:hypothetical protein